MTSITTTPGPAQRPAAGYTVAQLNAEYGPDGMPNQDLSFSQVLSMLNPLQYIPIVGSVYRAVTGDTIPPAAQVLSGALLGGPLGLVASAADAILQQATGKDLGDCVVGMFIPDSKTPGTNPPATQYAANTAPQAAAASGLSAGGSGTNSSSANGSSPGAAQPATAVSASAVSSLMPAAPQAVATTGASTATPPAPPPKPASPPAASAPAAVNAPAAVAEPVAVPTRSPPMTVTKLATPAAGAKTATGWTLADYRMFAGHGMPPSSGSNGMEFHNNPVPLQTQIPLPGETSHTPVVPNLTPATTTPAAATTTTPADPTSSNTTAAPQAQGTWVSQAMMRGLDRYRQMMIQQEQQQDQPPSAAPATAPAAVPAAPSQQKQ